jgi:threonylcarbamoyladenosine tRNA methylthiotransferase MtaB
MEGPRLGRTEQFAPVRFAADRPVGGIVEARIDGVGPGHLTAT